MLLFEISEKISENKSKDISINLRYLKRYLIVLKSLEYRELRYLKISKIS